MSLSTPTNSARSLTFPLQAGTVRLLVWTVLGLCMALLVALSFAVEGGYAFGWWDFSLAHVAEVTANGYNDVTILGTFRIIMIPVDWRSTVALVGVAMAILAWRRAGLLTLLPLVLVLTVVLEYLTKQVIHQPWPTPGVIMQPSLDLAAAARAQEPQNVCSLALDLSRSQLMAPGCQDGAFLSGAAARAVILSGVALWWLAGQRALRDLRYLLMALPVAYVVAVDVGRVYLRWHWPSDVVGGNLLGVVCLCALWLIAHSVREARS